MSKRLAIDVIPDTGWRATHPHPTFLGDRLTYPRFAHEIWPEKKIEFPFGNGCHKFAALWASIPQTLKGPL